MNHGIKNNVEAKRRKGLNFLVSYVWTIILPINAKRRKGLNFLVSYVWTIILPINAPRWRNL
jgi:hypothetical protein